MTIHCPFAHQPRKSIADPRLANWIRFAFCLWPPCQVTERRCEGSHHRRVFLSCGRDSPQRPRRKRVGWAPEKREGYPKRESTYGWPSKNRGNHPFVHRVFHYKLSILIWGTIIVGNTHIPPGEKGKSSTQKCQEVKRKGLC